MSSRLLVLRQLAVVPPGHGVEVRLFHRPSRSLWDGSFTDWDGEVVHDEAWVRDADTGATYVVDWMVRREDGSLEEGLLRGLKVSERIVGRVRSCQVITVEGGEGIFLRTQLTIDVGEPAEGYRGA